MTDSEMYEKGWNDAIEAIARLVEEHFDPCEPWFDADSVRKLLIKRQT